MQIPGEPIGILADDLTGACDTALQFNTQGANTRVLLDYTAATPTAGFQTWVLNTDSRHRQQFDAAAAVRKSVRFLRKEVGLDRFYKKIDSTLRGHIAEECLAILDELRWQAAIIAPAYPEEDRRTVGGYQLVRGLPVGQTETARDPLFPVRESHLPTLLGQTSDPGIVGHIPLRKVMDGAGPLLKAIQEQIQAHKKLIVVDACSDTDLEQLSLAINKMPSDTNVLPCGSAGLAKALSKKWVPHIEAHPRPHVIIEKTPLLMVIGSASRITQAQVDQFITHYQDYSPDARLMQIHLSPQEILGLTPLDNVIMQVRAALETHETVIVSTSLGQDSIANTMTVAEEQNIAPIDASARASRTLAELTRQVLDGRAAKLLLSGGETAQAICQAIGSRTLQIIDPIEASIPMMIDDQARWIVTKSGGFGTPMSLLNIFTTLKTLESELEAGRV